MTKFKNKQLGTIVETDNKFVIKQYEQSDAWQKVGGSAPAEQKEKTLEQMNKAELTAKADELGIEIDDDATKAQIIEAINAPAAAEGDE